MTIALLIVAGACAIGALATYVAVIRLAWGFYRLSRYATMEQTRTSAQLGLMASLVFLFVLSVIGGRIVYDLATTPVRAEAAP